MRFDQVKSSKPPSLSTWWLGLGLGLGLGVGGWGRLGVEHPAYLGEDRHGLCEVVDAHLGG